MGRAKSGPCLCAGRALFFLPCQFSTEFSDAFCSVA
jgi:hypothetical protein